MQPPGVSSTPANRSQPISLEALPVPLLELDLSAVWSLISKTGSAEVDCHELLTQQPELLPRCAAVVQGRACNSAAQQLIFAGSVPDQEGYRQLFSKAGQALFLELLQNLEQSPRFSVQGTLQLAEGSLHAELHVQRLETKDPNGSRVMLMVIDRDAQRLAEEELRRRESSYRKLYEQFRVLFEGIPDCLLIISADLKIAWANQATAATCQRPVEALVGHNCRQLAGQLNLPYDQDLIEACFQSGETRTGVATTQDGRHWGLRIFPIQEGSGQFRQVMLLAHDITEKIRLQSEALHTGQLAVLGELAAGVAHEINNPVNGIINYAQILINRLPQGEHSDIAARILKEGDRIARIVSALLSFARNSDEELRPIILEDILQESLTLCGTQLRKDGINLRLDLAEDLPCIWARRQQLEQVLINLISNARQALNQRYPDQDPDKLLEITARHDQNGWCRLTICDHGVGIPDHLLEKIFTPFFSTRPPGTGTGLGLSTSHGIIQNHGGRLSIESTAGHYTQIHIDLPLAGQDP